MPVCCQSCPKRSVLIFHPFLSSHLVRFYQQVDIFLEQQMLNLDSDVVSISLVQSPFPCAAVAQDSSICIYLLVAHLYYYCLSIKINSKIRFAWFKHLFCCLLNPPLFPCFHIPHVPLEILTVQGS